MWRSDGFEMLQYEGKTKKYHCCNPPVAHSTCYKGVTFPCAMAKESVNLQKNNTKSFISIFLIGNYIQSYSLKPLKGCKFSN